MTISIETFRPEHASRFAELNREWLLRYNLLEPADEEQLADPQRHFLDTGGQVFVALHDGQVVGTCAIFPHDSEAREIAKLAVSADSRGRGLARRLVEQCIAHAREQGARRVILLSNSQLQPALHLYQSLGFRFHPVPGVRAYQTADVYMVLDLEPAQGTEFESGRFRRPPEP